MDDAAVPVAIVKTDKASGARRAVELLGGMERFVRSGDRVIVKPNVCAAKGSSTGTVTDPEMVAEVCRMVSECGGEALVAESPIFPFNSGRVFRKAGYSDFESRYGFPLLDLDSEEGCGIRVPGGLVLDHSVVPKVVLTCDVLINMPVMKTHLQTVVSLGLKNLKGVVQGKQKHVIHLVGLDAGIVDLNTVIRSDLTIIDGIIGMEGFGGPTNGRAVRMDVVVAGDNVVEADATGVRVMGGEPGKVEHVRLASERGLGSLDGFELLGDGLESVARERELPRRPELNRAIISGTMLRGWNLLRDPVMRLVGGERVERSSRVGDLVMDSDACDGCRLCLPACPVDAMSFDEVLRCDREACIRCFCCAEVCPRGALSKRFA